MSVPLLALIVEDSEDDALLVMEELRDGGYNLTCERVETKGTLESALDEQRWDIIIADYRLPNFSGLDALKLVRERDPDIPFIIVSGQITEDTAVEAMRSGAQDYVLKDNLARLVPAVEREMREVGIHREHRYTEEALKAEQARTTTILESIADAFIAVDRDWRFTYVNGEAERVLGKDWRSLKCKNAWEEFPKAVESMLLGELQKAISEQVPVTVDLLYEPLDKWFGVRAYPSPDGLSVYFRDITERVRAEQELQQSRNDLEEALNREQHFSLLLQRALLPSIPIIGPGYDVAAEYVPAFVNREIGGDFYDVFRVGECRAGVLIGDVSGKGLEAAAMAATTRSTVHAFVHETASAAKALTKANSVLYLEQPDFGPFVTVFLAVIDLCTGNIVYSSAGHPPAAICRSDGIVEFLELGELPLAVLQEQHFEDFSSHIDPGDRLVLYTDGISEARHDSKLLDLEGIQQTLIEHATMPVIKLAHALVDTATNYAHGKLSDDAAVVIVGRQ